LLEFEKLQKDQESARLEEMLIENLARQSKQE
jgi:hypothetical protein